ncbi:MAG: hypothetical protein AMXMBFR82_51770 [Candidatus Hydrogenedentota bacterium]
MGSAASSEQPWEGWEYPAGAASLTGSMLHSERRQVWRVLESYSDFEEDRPDIHFIRPGMGRHIQGPAHVNFAPGELGVSGTLQSTNDLFLPAVCIAAVLGAWAAKGLLNQTWWWIPVTILLWATGLGLSYWTDRRVASKMESAPQPYVFRHADLRRAQFYGPIMKLWFRQSPLPGIKMLCLYVPPHFRETFYAEFDRAFPSVLPQAYSRALE